MALFHSIFGWVYFIIHIYHIFFFWHFRVALALKFLRLGAKPELQLLAYTTATAKPDPSHTCKLHYNSWQCQILSPLRKASDQTSILWILVGFLTHWATTRSPYIYQIFIHSSVDGHLGCFHALAIVNSATMNIGKLRFKNQTQGYHRGNWRGGRNREDRNNIYTLLYKIGN